MPQAITKPNIPTQAATLCAIGEVGEEIVSALTNRCVNVLRLTRDKRLGYAVAGHADMLICHTHSDHIVCGSEANYQCVKAAGFQAIMAQRAPQPDYPSDVHLNQLIMGTFAAGRMDACDPAVKLALSQRQIPYVDIRQGYAKCSSAVIGENALITADYSVAKAATRYGIDVLVIRPGHIELPDFEYGFIGGTCGLIAPDRLAIVGDIRQHPDGESMCAFAKRHGVTVDCICAGPLRDIGGILPLME